jgi:hypothetical protein
MADSTKNPQPGRRRTRTFATPDGVAGRTSLPGLATGLPYKRVRSGLSIREAVAHSAPRHCRGSRRGEILRRHEVSPQNALGAARLIGLRAAWYGPDGELLTSPRPASPQALATSAIGSALFDRFNGPPGGADRPGGWWILFGPELHLGEDVLVPDHAASGASGCPSSPTSPRSSLRPTGCAR